MLYNNLTITIAQRQQAGYPVLMSADGLGRVSAMLSTPSADLRHLLAHAPISDEPRPDILLRTGQEIFRWLFAADLDTHLRIAWDRAERLGHGLRIRLSMDPPELAALPWELLYDPSRDHLFSTSISTLLVRYLDQSNRFGGLANQLVELPLNLLLIVPQTPDLDPSKERRSVEEALAGLQDLVNLTVLDGVVTRQSLSDALVETPFHVVHFAGHGTFSHGEGFIALNMTEGKADVVDAQSFGRLLGNHRTLRLVVLNACSTGRTNSHRAFVGLAPQLVSHGVPAVIAMHYPVLDAQAAAFAHEFYQQLCMGENNGQVDVAVTHARNMLAVLYPRSDAWAAPILHTHADNGLLFELATLIARQAGADPRRTALLLSSFQRSLELSEDWESAEASRLKGWRRTLKRAEQAYRTHLDDANPDAQQAARYGLALVTGRLEELDMRLAAISKDTSARTLKTSRGG
jgi:hypothetical protein